MWALTIYYNIHFSWHKIINNFLDIISCLINFKYKHVEKTNFNANILGNLKSSLEIDFTLFFAKLTSGIKEMFLALIKKFFLRIKQKIDDKKTIYF